MVLAQNEQKILVQENIPSPYFPVIVLEVRDLLDSYSPCRHIVLAGRRYIAAAQYCRQGVSLRQTSDSESADMLATIAATDVVATHLGLPAALLPRYHARAHRTSIHCDGA